MTHSGFRIRAFLLIAICCSLAHAQQPNSTSKTEADEGLRQKAFDLLESLAGEISSLQSPENRARLGANIADSLWEHDESRARALLASAEDDINAGLNTQVANRLPDFQRRMVFLQLRMNTVERIARHNPELALRFFRESKPIPDQSPTDARSQLTTQQLDEEERTVELNLAKAVARSNPEIALELARQALSSGLPKSIVPVVFELMRNHKDQGQTLYGEIIAKLKERDLVHDATAFYFAQSLALIVPPPFVDDDTYRQLADILLSSAAANGCQTKMADGDRRSQYCRRVSSLLPQLRRVNPAGASKLSQWADANQETSDYHRWDGYDELNQIAANGSVEQILELTAKYPGLEESIRWSALQKAQTDGNYEQARKIANEYTGNPEVQRRMLTQIDRQEKFANQISDSLRDIQTKLAAITDVNEQFRFLLYAASQVAVVDQKQAWKLLDQAQQVSETLKPGKDVLDAQLMLAFMYCAERNPRGFDIMESLMPKLNDLVGAAAKLDGYENSYLRDGEWNMSSAGTIGSRLTGLANNAPYFAWCDFDRAVRIAGELERPEIRVMAQVKLAQGILAGPPRSTRSLLPSY